VDAFEKLAQEIVKMDVKTILIVSPHAPLVEQGMVLIGGNNVSGSLRNFGAGHIRFAYETDDFIVEAIGRQIPGIRKIESELDHGVLVPLYYLQKAGWDGKLAVLGMPLQNAEDYGKKVGQILNYSPGRCALIASGDLSHRLKEDGPYGFHPSGPKFDTRLVKGLKKDTTVIRSLPPDCWKRRGNAAITRYCLLWGQEKAQSKSFPMKGPSGSVIWWPKFTAPHRLPGLPGNA
jgi:aromatic ring-opening dioxygenase LigB subunit